MRAFGGGLLGAALANVLAPYKPKQLLPSHQIASNQASCPAGFAVAQLSTQYVSPLGQASAHTA